MEKRKFTSEFKVKIVLELLREERTLGEIAADYQLNPNQLANWRREFLEKAPGVFNEPAKTRERKKLDKETAEKEARMLKTIGQLTMERDFLLAARAKITERGSL